MAENEAPQAQLQACAADDQREATELQPRPTPISEVEGQQDSTEPREAETPRSTDHLSCVRKYGFAITRFWTHQVFLSVSHDDCRDHFALERTYLGYLRTSLAFANLGVVIAQLFRLQAQRSPGPEPTLFDVGIPLAAAFICIATIIALLGAVRFWKQQNAMARKKVYARGWELNAVASFTLGALLTLFVIIVAVDTTY
ncbi:hypothetical protein MMC14_002727 [Varicellaria rhodocarpa]|nr:hypothetical protein [Varicellaria rhodocarpa]